jgi:hypothetical protein
MQRMMSVGKPKRDAEVFVVAMVDMLLLLLV